jgi:hypothetical protein
MTTTAQTGSNRSQHAGLPPAHAQTGVAPEKLLNSVTAGVVVERVGQLKNGLRSEGRQFARQVAEHMNRKYQGIVSVFLYEETFGTKDRLHWFIHLRSLTDYETLVRMGTSDEEFRSIVMSHQIPPEKGGGGWDKMFLDGSLKETVMLPQFWGMYGTAAEVPDIQGLKGSDPLLTVPPAREQCPFPMSEILHSGNCGLVLHRTAQISYEFRSEGRKFAREICRSINEKQKGEVSVFLYEEAFGSADRIHWLMHMKSMASFYSMLKMHAVDQEERNYYFQETIASERGGGNWSRMIVEGSMLDCALTPQHWGMYATQTPKT